MPMLHTIIIKITHIGWLGLPYPLYALYSKHYLDQKQAQLLIIQAILLMSLMLAGWLMHFVRMLGTGYFVLIVLDLCIIEYQQFISRYEQKQPDSHPPQHNHSKTYSQINNKPLFMLSRYKLLKKFKLHQTFIFPILVFLWFLLRIKFTTATEYGIGHIFADGLQFKGFLQSYDGWNCNYPQFHTIPCLWLLVLLFSHYLINGILNNCKQDPNIHNYIDINGYKIYLLAYLIKPALAVLLIDVLFNIYAHYSCDGLLECYAYFKYGCVVVMVVCWGLPACVGLFFWVKVGRFEMQSEADNSQLEHSDEIQEIEDMAARKGLDKQNRLNTKLTL